MMYPPDLKGRKTETETGTLNETSYSVILLHS